MSEEPSISIRNRLIVLFVVAGVLALLSIQIAGNWVVPLGVFYIVVRMGRDFLLSRGAIFSLAIAGLFGAAACMWFAIFR